MRAAGQNAAGARPGWVGGGSTSKPCAKRHAPMLAAMAPAMAARTSVLSGHGFVPEPMCRAGAKGRRHNGGCTHPKGAKRSAAVLPPSALCARLATLCATARYVKWRSHFPRSDCQGSARLDAWPALFLVALRAAPDLYGWGASAPPVASRRRSVGAGLAAARPVTVAGPTRTRSAARWSARPLQRHLNNCVATLPLRTPV